jgi:hypothetical protein
LGWIRINWQGWSNSKTTCGRWRTSCAPTPSSPPVNTACPCWASSPPPRHQPFRHGHAPNPGGPGRRPDAEAADSQGGL